jgi:hypothetical protein
MSSQSQESFQSLSKTYLSHQSPFIGQSIIAHHLSLLSTLGT